MLRQIGADKAAVTVGMSAEEVDEHVTHGHIADVQFFAQFACAKVLIEYKEVKLGRTGAF